MKHAADRPYADSEKAAPAPRDRQRRRADRCRIQIEKINAPFLYKGTPAEYGVGMKLAIERGWLEMHESGTYVTFAPAGAELSS